MMNLWRENELEENELENYDAMVCENFGLPETP